MHSIKTKLVVGVVAGSLLALGVTVAVAVHTARAVATDLAYRETAQLVQRHAHAADADLAAYRTLTRGLAEAYQGYATYVTNKWPFQKRFDATVMLREVAEAQPEVRRLALGFEPDAFDGRDWRYGNDDDFHDATGRFVPAWVKGADGTLAATPAQGYDTHDWYRVPRETHAEYVSEPYVSDGTLTVTFTAPILDEDGAFLGAASADVAIDDLAEAVAAVEVYDTGYAFMVSRTGAFTAHPDEALVGEQTLSGYADAEGGAAFAALAEAVADGESGHVEAVDPRTGQEAVFFYASLPTAGGAVVAVVPAAEMLAPMHAMTQTLLRVGLLGLGLLGMIGFLLAVHIVRPIRRIGEAAGRVVAGDTSARTDVTRRDELGDLVESFNGMAQRIEDGVSEAEERYAEAEAAVAEAGEARTRAEAQAQHFTSVIDRLQEAVERFADGDLTVGLPVEGDDAVARLYASVNRAVETFRTVLREVVAASGTSAEASAEIGAFVERLAAASREQSIQATEGVAAVEEMVRTITDNAQTASQAAEATQANGAVARGGREVVVATTDKVRQIAEVVVRSAETVERLGASSREIGAIVETIDDIADQTNLLALNAAIEAARASEHGRGFAVVADEVRKLAERTTQATDEIARMIQTIQAETAEAVGAIRQGEGEVEAGIALVEKTRQALERVVEGIAETEAMVGRIAAASEEQAVMSEQIARNVEGLSTAAGESVRGVAQVAGATDEQRRCNGSLAELVARFRLVESSSTQPIPHRGNGSRENDKGNGNGCPAVRPVLTS